MIDAGFLILAIDFCVAVLLILLMDLTVDDYENGMD